jgi:hypothetical protein
VGASTNPLVKPHTLSITKPIVSPKLQDLTKTNLQNRLQDLTKTNLQNKLQNVTKPLVKPQVKTQTQIKTQVKVQTKVKVQTPPKPITPRPLKPLLLPGAPKVGGPEALPPGTVTWNQGIQKKTLIPGEVKPRSTYRRSHPKGSGVPSTSLRVVGGPSDIIEARVDLGVTDLYIDPVRGRVAFRPGGLKTNISENLGNTQGMKLLRKPKEVLRAPTQKQEKPGLISRIIRGK